MAEARNPIYRYADSKIGDQQKRRNASLSGRLPVIGIVCNMQASELRLCTYVSTGIQLQVRERLTIMK